MKNKVKTATQLKNNDTHVNGIILGFMTATALLSMWISNTTTTVMMLPIGSLPGYYIPTNWAGLLPAGD